MARVSALAAFYGAFQRRFALISTDPEQAVVEGMRVRFWDFLLYAASLLGLWASFHLDLPTGAAIVCACGLMLVVVSGVTIMRRA